MKRSSALAALVLWQILIAGAASAEEQARAPRTFADALVTGFVGLDFGARQLHYRDRVSNGNLRPYDLPNGPLLPVAPGLAFSAELFPFAGTTWGFARDLGLSSHANYNFVSSKVGNVSPTTRWYAWELDLRGRFRLGPVDLPSVLGVEAGLGRQAFLFSTPNAAQDILPSVDYHYLRLGVDGRIPIGQAAVIVGAAYRSLLSKGGPGGVTVPAAGQLGDHFPHASIAGADFKLGGALPLRAGIEARVQLNYARYWAALHPAPGAAYVAAGATDQLLNVDIGVAAFF